MTNKQYYIDVRIEVDPHWLQLAFGEGDPTPEQVMRKIQAGQVGLIMSAKVKAFGFTQENRSWHQPR